MKKSRSLLIVCLSIFSIAGLVGCGGTSNSDQIGAATRAVVAQAEKLSRDELFQKAADEIQGNEFKFIGTTSRFKKAIDGFKAELVKKNTACSAMTITKDSTVDGKIYTTLLGEIEAGITDGYNGAIVQDGYQLQKKGIDTGYFINYVPKEWADASDTDKEVNKEPLALQYNFKTWIYNNANKDTTIDNVWDITAPAFNGKLQTMDPTSENVNMDWLIMLTQEKWCNVLKTAFEDSSNGNSSLDLSKYAKYGELKKYAYAFIDGYLTNSVFNADDGAARDNLDKKSASGTAGWIVYSKIAGITETAEVSKKFLVNAALGEDNTDGNTATSHIKGFGGFMYKHYLQVMPNAKYPWTTCAFINYLCTTKDGFKGWASDIGDYPSMPSINVDRTKYGHGTLTADYKWTQSDTGENVFPIMNDPASSWWTASTGGNVVVEDPSYIATQYNAVMAFINTVIANKS